MLPVLERNRNAVLARIARACERAGRPAADVELVAVTKTVAPAVAEALRSLGQRDLGENRLAALEEKRAWFAERGLDARWHFVGHVQRNKARKIALAADLVHSVDSLALVDALGRACAEVGRPLGVFLQVALTGEEHKSGLDEADVPAAVEHVAARPPLRLEGLMAMGPLAAPGDQAAAARAVFERLAALAAELPAERFAAGRPRLSMGMTEDLEEAVAAGADLVRVGRALFEDLEPAARERARRRG